MAHNPVSENLGVCLLQSETVILLILVPLLKLDNHVYALCLLDTLNSEKALDIYNTDSAKLYKMPCDIRCCSDKCLITYLLNLNNIIRYKTMSSLDELQRCLTLTDTALTHNKNTLAEYINQYTMNRDCRCKLYLKPTYNLRHK